MKFRAFAFAAITMLTAGSLFASVTEEETFSFKLNDGGRFSISNVNGSIVVTGGLGDSVEIITSNLSTVADAAPGNVFYTK